MTVCKPIKPINSLVLINEAAQNPHPNLLMYSEKRLTDSSLSSLLKSPGKYSLTRGSALSCAKASRSFSHHWRKIRRLECHFMI